MAGVVIHQWLRNNMLKKPNYLFIRVLMSLAAWCACVRGLSANEPADAFRPPAIATQDVPVVPRELVDRLRQYQNMREA